MCIKLSRLVDLVFYNSSKSAGLMYDELCTYVIVEG